MTPASAVGRLAVALEMMSMSGSVLVQGPEPRWYEQLLAPPPCEPGRAFLPLESGVYLLDLDGPRIVPYETFVADVSVNSVTDEPVFDFLSRKKQLIYRPEG